MSEHRFANWCAVTAMLGLTLLVGCYGHSSAYVETDVPVAVETYPRAYYDGEIVYWGGDRWYVRRGGVWFYYRAEPDYLYRYRSGWPHHHYGPWPRSYRYHRELAPPARRYVPPARRYAPPARRYAPPARR